MTAVLGILNKYSVALAADSAVTVGLLNGDSKIFNRANKLFSLSKYYPIGIMLYNSASFMNTPWEIIIKLYRKQLKKTSFDTVEEYQKDFIKFLHDKAFFVQGDDELQFLQAYFERKINKVNSDLIVLHKINPSAFVTEGVKEDFFVKLSADLDKRIAQLISASDFCDELKDLTIDEFNEKPTSLCDVKNCCFSG